MSEDAGISRTIGIVGTIIAVAVAFNGMVTACSQQRLDSHASFRQAVKDEEQFWRGLYDDYLSTFSDELEDDEEQRQAKLLAIQTLAQREVPSFTEYSSIENERAAHEKRLKEMRRALISALQFDGLASDEAKAELREQSFQQAATQSAPAVGERIAGRTSTIGRQDIVREEFTVADVNSNGWDLKFYWCPTPGDESVELFNYSQALSFANAFANLAKERRNVIPGTPVGTVRVGPVTDSLRKRVNVAQERWVTWDEGPGEEAMAEEVKALLESTARQDFKVFRSTGTPSPFYTSVWSCSASLPDQSRAAPQ